MHILIADESELLRGVMVKILRLGLPDADITEAGTTSGTIAACKAAVPDVLIIDRAGMLLNCREIVGYLDEHQLAPRFIFTSQFREVPAQFLALTARGALVMKEDLTMLPQIIAAGAKQPEGV